jgi:hypothetical protein
LEHSHRFGRKKIVSRTFSLDTPVKPLTLLARAKKAAYAKGATVVGDERSGHFSHEMAEGEYRMVGQKVIVTVTDKHWLLPWAVVEAQLRELVL